MNRRNFAVIAALFACLPLASFAQDAETNGNNVNNVEVSEQGGSLTGLFQQVGDRTWAEKTADGKTRFTFQEQRREANSVQLFDASRNAFIRLDLRARKVMYKEGPGGQEQEISRILKAFSGMTGFICKSVRFADGSLVQVGGKDWEERGSNGAAKFKFQEVKRDEWSVYLTDKSRGISLRIDLEHFKVMYREGGGAEKLLYDIL